MLIWQFLADERSIMSVPALALAAAGGLALTHGLAHGLGREGLGWGLGVGLAAGVRTRRSGNGWEWDCGGEVLLSERNVARDARLAQVPARGYEQDGIVHTGERELVVTWQWPGDGRVFLVPARILELVPRHIGLARDIIAVTGHLYRQQHYPDNRTVTTSYRQLAEMLRLEWAGQRLVNDLDEALLIARWITIRDYPVIRKLFPDGHIKEQSRYTFGFINHFARLEIREGRKIPRNLQPLEIGLSEMYAHAIKILPAAPIPLAALEATHVAPRSLRIPAKNLVYYLASRVPLQHVKLSLATLVEILGYRNSRKYEIRQSIERVARILEGVIIRDYTYDQANDVYTFVLAGKPSQSKLDGT
ncbi:MAG: hypothetical protein ACPLRW_11915 [Moorellales bacterium]